MTDVGVRFGEYEVREVLGKGAFAKVRLVVNQKTGMKYAAKVIKKAGMSARAIDRLNLEIAITKNITHPNVIKLHEVINSTSKYWLIADFYAKGELLKYMKGPLSDEKAFEYFIQLACAIRYCHKFGICHRDVKFENILVSDDNRLILTDFGLGAISYSPDKTFYSQITCCGSAHYIAPEVMMGLKYDGRKADVWSLGIILYAMLTGSLPFKCTNVEELMESMNAHAFPLPDTLTKDARSLLLLLLEPDPQRRPDWKGIFTHPWVASRCSIERNSHKYEACEFPNDVQEEPALCRIQLLTKQYASLEDKAHPGTYTIPFLPSQQAYRELDKIHSAVRGISGDLSHIEPQALKPNDSTFSCLTCNLPLTPPQTADLTGYPVKKALRLAEMNLSNCLILAAYGLRKIVRVPVTVYLHRFAAVSEERVAEVRIFGTDRLFMLIGCQSVKIYDEISSILTALCADSRKLGKVTLTRITDVTLTCDATNE